MKKWFVKKVSQEPGDDLKLKPWMTRKEWRNPIASSAKLGLRTIWFFAVFWNAALTLMLLEMPNEVLRGNTPALITYLFPLTGVGLLILALFKTAQWRRFGNTMLTLNPYPGSIGGQVGGSLDLPLGYDKNQLFEVSLSCIHSYLSETIDGQERNESVKWHSDGFAQQAPIGQGTRLAFYFDVPAGLPASEESTESSYLWRLTLSADLPGTDFERVFTVPVFPTEQLASGALPNAIIHPKAEAAREKDLEQLLNAKRLTGGVALNYPMWRNPLLNSMTALVGWLFFATGILLWTSGDPKFFAAIFGVTGGGIGLAGTYALLNRYVVKIGERGIYVQRFILGFSIGNQFYAPELVSHLAIKPHGSSKVGNKHTEHFVINAHLHDGKKVRVVESINGRELAQLALESVSRLSGFSAQVGEQ